jgi:hypothetical protein
MRTVEIRKKSLKTWLHIDSIYGQFIVSKFYFNADNNQFQVVEQGQSKRFIYDVLNITVYDDTASSTPETFTNITDLSLRLEVLKYPAFYQEGEVVVSGIEDIFEGTNVTIDKTDPSNPIISATGGGGGAVDSVNGQTGVVSIDLQSVTDEGNTVTDGTSTTTIGQGTIEIDNDEFECLIFSNNGDNTGTISNVANGVQYETQNNSTSKNTKYRNGDVVYQPSGSDAPINLNIPYTGETDGNTFATREWAVANITGGGATNLGYTPSPTDGTVTSSTGTDATIPLATGTNAGLLSPSFWTVLTNFATNVRSTVLTGLSSSSGTFTSTNTILEAFGKIKYFIDNIQTVIGAHVNLLLNDTVSTSSVTGTALETSVKTILIPANTFASGDSFTIDAQFNRDATNLANCTVRLRTSTSGTFSTSHPVVALANSLTANYSCPLIRTACFKSASSFEVINTSIVANNDTSASSTAQASTIPFDTTVDNYFYLSIALANTSDSFFLSRVRIDRRKQKSTI